MTPMRALPSSAAELATRPPRAWRVEPDRPPDPTLVAITAPGSLEAEQYRTLGVALERLHRGLPSLVVTITSARPGEGKTTTAINLAAVIAEAASARVLLIDADLRRPQVMNRLGLESWDGPSLTERLGAPPGSPEPITTRTSPFRISVLPAGRPTEEPSALLRSARLPEIMQAARETFDWVIVDAPPLLPVPDCGLLAPFTDGVLMVVAAHRTPREFVREALDALEPERLLGIVFIGDDRRMSRYQKYYSSYISSRARGETPLT